MSKLKTNNKIIENIKSIPKVGGVYFWYIDREGATKLGIPIDGCTVKGEYYLIYIGESKDLRERLEWHTTGKHTLFGTPTTKLKSDFGVPTNIKSGFLSGLRQKLSALLFGNWHSKKAVDELMDNHMRVEYQTNPECKQLPLI